MQYNIETQLEESSLLSLISQSMLHLIMICPTGGRRLLQVPAAQAPAHTGSTSFNAG